jgi:outer membrane protein insertion porin family
MRQLEGAYFDASKVQLSKTRIDRTQYFKDVTVETTPVAGTTDQVDVAYTVEEKPTGAVLLGAGFSSVEKLIVSGSIAQQNVFGSGKSISINVNSGRVNQVYAFSYLNPYYTIDGVSQGFDFYKRDTDASTLAVGAYTTRTIGGGLRFGYPLSEADSVSFGVSAESVKLETFSNSPISYVNFVNDFGNKYAYGAGTLGVASDTRDSAIQTTRGSVSRTSVEIAGGDLQYYRINVSYQWYYPLSRTMTLLLNGDAGYAHGIGDKPVPFFKNYYAGGPGSVRGFRPFSLGPQDALGNSLGGSRKIVGSAEVLFPIPGAHQDKSLRMAAFLDFGQVFGVGEKFSLGDIRYAAGLALAWTSPFGPLKLSIAQPLNDKPGFDRVQRLQFTFGQSF